VPCCDRTAPNTPGNDDVDDREKGIIIHINTEKSAMRLLLARGLERGHAFHPFEDERPRPEETLDTSQLHERISSNARASVAP